MDTHHLSVRRTARYHLLGGPGPARDVWFALHGYGQLARSFLEGFQGVVGEGRRFVAPEGLSRFYLRSGSGRIGASWMTREERAEEIQDHVAYLDELHAHLAGTLEGARVGVLGFSQGTAAAARWAVLGGVRPARLILWGGGFPPDLDEDRTRAALASTTVDLVAGDGDEVLPPDLFQVELARLRSMAPEVRPHRFQGGHRLDGGLLGQLLADW